LSAHRSRVDEYLYGIAISATVETVFNTAVIVGMLVATNT
jgi:hypothetical protein